jgi:hypothetical protein
MWRALEPLHAVTYFAPPSLDALRATGLRGFWMAYFAARSAPMGAAPASVVEATFFNFAPWLVRRAIPDAWSFATPTAVLDARWAGVSATLGPLAGALTDGSRERASSLLERAVDGLNCDGRALAASNAALALPDDELAAVWQLVTTLREHRGDGHVAALVGAGLTGLEAHLTLVGAGTITREVLQPARGFTDDEWSAAAAALADRGLLEGDGALTAAGRALRADLEATTDRLAAEPWRRLGDDGCGSLLEQLAPLTQAVAAAGIVPVLNPIGLPEE